ncbi:MAG: stage II sporulation protein R [Dethiobacteria bacterium]
MNRNPEIKAIKGPTAVLALLAGLALLMGLPNLYAGACPSRELPWEIQDPGEPVIRLHLLAHSDAPQDQAAKMAMAEAVQEMVGAELARSEVPVPRRIQEIAAVLRAELPARFPGQPLEIRLEREYFPLRVYGIRVFPPGEYLALKVVIGKGEGKNWWCLLFPSLCFPLAECEEDDEALTDEDLPDPEKQERCWSFYLLEWWKRWWAKVLKKVNESNIMSMGNEQMNKA